MLNFEIRKKYFSFLAKKISDIYEIITGVPPLFLPNSKGENLKSYSISGNVDEEIIAYSDGTAIEGKPNLLRTAGKTEQAVSGNAQTKRILQGDKYIKGIAIDNSLIVSTTNVQIGVNGISCSISAVGGTVALPVKLKNNVSYSINATISSGGQIRIISYQKDGTFNGEISTSASGTVKRFIVPNNADIVCILLRRAGSTDESPYTFSDLMLVEGTYTSANMPAYTPYKQLLTDYSGVGDFDNTTNKYKIPVLSSGINLAPYPYITSAGTIQSVIWTVGNNGHISATGTSTGGLNFILFNINSNFKLTKGTYTICVKGKHQGVTLYYRNESVSPTQQAYIASSANDACVTFTIENDIENNHRLYFNVPAANTTVDVDCTVMLVAGEYSVSTMPNYQKYVAGTQTDIFITPKSEISLTGTTDFEQGGITSATGKTTTTITRVRTKTLKPVDNTSLFKTGENIDTVNYPQNKTVKAVGKYVFTGTENIELYDNSKGFRFAVSDMETGNCLDGFCNRFENFKNVTDNDVPRVFFGYNNNYVYFRRFSDTAMTVEAIKSTLANWYSSGKPLTIWYPLEEEVEEAISLPDIPTIQGNATIMIDTNVQPSEMSVEYAVEGA